MPRLLFDENLSPSLKIHLADSYPGSLHVRDVGLRGGSDSEIWAVAAKEDLIIVTKDDDFRQLSFLRGGPPKVVWLVVGNAGTGFISELLEQHRSDIEALENDAVEAILVLRSALA